jgi:hypothetical protein
MIEGLRNMLARRKTSLAWRHVPDGEMQRDGGPRASALSRQCHVIRKPRNSRISARDPGRYRPACAA